MTEIKNILLDSMYWAIVVLYWGLKRLRNNRLGWIYLFLLFQLILMSWIVCCVTLHDAKNVVSFKIYLIRIDFRKWILLKRFFLLYLLRFTRFFNLIIHVSFLKICTFDNIIFSILQIYSSPVQILKGFKHH